MATRAFDDWARSGRTIEVGDHRIWMADFPPLERATGDPVFVLHGYPTSSFDWHRVLPTLRAHRRVVVLDLIGFGLSDKPDQRYSIEGYADVAQAVADAAGLTTVALVTHDLGDSVGGELLARALDGTLPFAVSERIVTNGSIYMELAQLSAGQQMLLAADDAPIDLAAAGIDPGEGFRRGVGGTFADPARADPEELDRAWEFASYHDGHKMLARTIRYIEDRRAKESRYTGAIERHDAPLSVIWGELDPIAVHPMAIRLHERVPGSKLETLEGIAHYPMIEDPTRFAAALEGALG
ncbi:MAG TPA: alpha/beta hydrolase [Acidimicrobiia bacterium]|jgi:pimeloyl-ACP methyl ester carboxylesterase